MDDKNYDSGKQELLINQITSFYLNLSRNEENLEFLLSLKLFSKLKNLMTHFDKQSFGDTTALCYINTIFSKLLKY
jgi:hypothetical protein